ncbi:MAG: hypothetical protein OXN27_05580 [Candidatus Poribacteria bacterium]|nr:hypothetical protein [Candidatus Poribacteria bacterium]
MKYLLIFALLCIAIYCGCSETTNPVVEEPVAEELVVEEPIAEEPVVEEPIAEELVVENNFCSVGDLLQPGESCLDGTGDAFTVLEDGRGRYLFVTAGEGIRLFGNINGKVRSFSAEKQDDGTWKILSVTP